MKKKLLVLFGLCVAAIMIFAACANASFGGHERNISELRDNVFFGGDEDIRIEVVSGYRENPFVIDGDSGETVPFTVVTILPSAAVMRPSFSYRVDMNDSQFVGNFLPHPYLDTFSADIAASTGDRNIRVTITGEDFERVFELTSVVTDEMIGAEEAFDIAYARLTNSLSAFVNRGRLNAEIYIRLVTNPIAQGESYYWYIAFVTPCNNTFAALIDPISQEVLAVRE